MDKSKGLPYLSRPPSYLNSTDRKLLRQPSSVQREMIKPSKCSGLSMRFLGNNSWNLFDGIPDNFTVRMKVRMKLNNSRAGHKWDTFQTVLSLITCVVYVMSTYNAKYSQKTIEIVFLGFFMVDYLLRFYCCVNRWIYPFTFNAIIDMVTFAPPIIEFVFYNSQLNEAPTFAFMRFARILRVIRLLRAMKIIGKGNITAVDKQIMALVLTLVSIVFISAGLIQTVEKINRKPDAPQLAFGEAMYFIVVTISTVGYGDIAPLSNWGRAVTCGMIVLSLVVVPMELNRLTALLSMQSKYRTTYKPEHGNAHVLVFGKKTSANALLEFFTEFYHPDRFVCNTGGAADSIKIPCVIMSPQEPSEELRALLVNPALQGQVKYVKGSIMNDDDLYRVAADEARACFVLSDKISRNSKKEDSSTVLRSLIIENFNPNLMTFIQILREDNSSYLNQANVDQVLCIDRMKMSILGKSCIYPGTSTLISNMFRSSSYCGTDSCAWRAEYLRGKSHEIYTTTLPRLLNGCTYIQAVEIVYNVFGGKVTLLGVDEALDAIEASKLLKPFENEDCLPAQTLRGTIMELGIEVMKEEYDTIVNGIQQEPTISPHTVLQTCSENGTPIYVNPGSAFIVHSGIVVYVLCETRSLAESVAAEVYYQEWLEAGNKIPPVLATMSHESKRFSLSKADFVIRDLDKILLERCDPSMKLHTIVLADIAAISLRCCIEALRPRDEIDVEGDPHPIIFLSPGSDNFLPAVKALGSFRDLYAIKMGKDLKDDLSRAGIFKAKSCLLLADKFDTFEMEGEKLDSTTLFRYLSIQSLITDHSAKFDDDFFTVVEMTSTSTMRIMDTTLKRHENLTTKSNKRRASVARDLNGNVGESRRISAKESAINLTMRRVTGTTQDRKSRSKALKELQKNAKNVKRHGAMNSYSQLPFFAAGYGFSSDVFDSLLCQSFFTPELIRFTEKMLSMHLPSQNLSEKYASSSIRQIDIPGIYVGRVYQELFRFMVRQKQAIPIGLYRRSPDTSFPYVVTSPSRSTLLRKEDRVFILALPGVRFGNEKHHQGETPDSNSSLSDIRLTLEKVKSERQSLELQTKILESCDEEKAT